MSHCPAPLMTGFPCHKYREVTQYSVAIVSWHEKNLFAVISDIVSNLHSAEEIPIDVLRQREAKWLEMLNSWDKWMAKKHKKVCFVKCKLDLTSPFSFLVMVMCALQEFIQCALGCF